MGEKDFSEIARLSERYNKDPKSRIFVQLADAYRKSNMIDEALEILDKGLAFNPNYPLAYLILGKCYFDKRMYEQAKDSFGKTLKYDPQNIVALRMLAQTCEATKDEKGQMEAYRGILAIDPFDAPAKEKLTYLESIHKKEPLYTIAMAQEYEKQGNMEKALSIYENLSFTDPTDLVLQQKIAELKEKTKKEKQAVTEEKIDGLQLDTYFQPEDLGGKEEPVSSETEKDDTGALQDAPPAPEPIPEKTPTPEPVITEPVQPITPEATEEKEPEGLDLLEPVEPTATVQNEEPSTAPEPEKTIEPIEPAVEVKDESDLLQPIETVPEPEPAAPETAVPEPTEVTMTPPEPESTADLLQPIETVEEPIKEVEEPAVPKLVDIPEPELKTETPEPPAATPSDIPETSADLLQPVEEAEKIQEPEITKEDPAAETPGIQTEPKSEEPTIESTGSETPGVSEPSAESPPPKPMQKPEEAKPQEEDFQSFKDWLGGLLK